MYAYRIFFLLFVLERCFSPEFGGSFDGVKMSLESFKDFPFGLTNVLYATSFASDTVDEIGASACDVGFCRVSFSCDMACYCA